jgi:hypothetical protein
MFINIIQNIDQNFIKANAYIGHISINKDNMNKKLKNFWSFNNFERNNEIKLMSNDRFYQMILNADF